MQWLFIKCTSIQVRYIQCNVENWLGSEYWLFSTDHAALTQLWTMIVTKSIPENNLRSSWYHSDLAHKPHAEVTVWAHTDLKLKHHIDITVTSVMNSPGSNTVTSQYPHTVLILHSHTITKSFLDYWYYRSLCVWYPMNYVTNPIPLSDF